MVPLGGIGILLWAGMLQDSPASNNLLINNNVNNNELGGIVLFHTHGDTLKNNSVGSNHSGIDALSSDNIGIYLNTVADNSGDDSAAGIYLGSAASASEKENTISNNKVGFI